MFLNNLIAIVSIFLVSILMQGSLFVKFVSQVQHKLMENIWPNMFCHLHQQEPITYKNEQFWFILRMEFLSLNLPQFCQTKNINHNDTHHSCIFVERYWYQICWMIYIYYIEAIDVHMVIWWRPSEEGDELRSSIWQ